MRQLELAGFGRAVETPITLDRGSLDLLDLYSNHRLSQGASLRTVSREISHLRSIAREGVWHGHASLAELFASIPSVAAVLREPRRPIARSTGLARLVAAQRFINFITLLLGRSAVQDLCELDRLLPARSGTGWHSTGVIVAGGLDRPRHRPVSLGWSDLERIAEAASDGGSATWQRALVTLHCFTGLRPEEIITLRWNAIERTVVPMSDELRFSVSVQRRERPVLLPVIPRVAVELALYAGSLPASRLHRTELLFPSRQSASRPISYRTTRYILTHACREAGVPAVEASDLRAAFAFGLKLQGMSDHQVAAMLGLAQVRSVDRLLKGHRALQAQHAVREIFGMA
jgi:integrase